MSHLSELERYSTDFTGCLLGCDVGFKTEVAGCDWVFADCWGAFAGFGSDRCEIHVRNGLGKGFDWVVIEGEFVWDCTEGFPSLKWYGYAGCCEMSDGFNANVILGLAWSDTLESFPTSEMDFSKFSGRFAGLEWCLDGMKFGFDKDSHFPLFNTGFAELGKLGTVDIKGEEADDECISIGKKNKQKNKSLGKCICTLA